MNKKQLAFYIMIIINLCLIICFYYFQNKYTISENSLPQFLVENWKLYPNKLLAPNELQDYSYLNTWIGEYSGFSSISNDGSNFGVATYATEFPYIGDKSTLSLYIQEPFSAMKVYINGDLLWEQGNFQPYKSDIRDAIISFPAQKNNQIVIQVENHTHYYSGIYYPIAIGKTQDVTQMISLRLLFYGCLCFSSLAIALYSIVIWLQDRSSKEHRSHMIFGIFALSFAIYCAYPFGKLIGISATRLSYAIEDSMMMLCLYCAIKLSCLQMKEKKNNFVVSFYLPFSFSMIPLTFLFSFVLLSILPAFLNFYGIFVSSYKLITACIICWLSWKCRSSGTLNWLLMGTFSYGMYLIAGILLINRYEPISLGWMEEIGMFSMLLCFACLMVKRSHLLLKEHQQLSEHLQEEVNNQTAEIQNLLKERQDLLSQLLHDLKKPMSTANSYVQLIQRNGIALDEVTKKQLDIIASKQDIMNEQIKELQTINASEEMKYNMEPIDLCAFITDFHRLYLPDVEVSGQIFTIDLPANSCIVNADKTQLLRVFQNLLFNALRFTVMDDSISIIVEKSSDHAIIYFKDNGVGIKDDLQKNIFQHSFSTSSSDDHQGLGLFIAKSIIVQHHGSIEVKSEEGKGTCFILKLPIFLQ